MIGVFGFVRLVDENGFFQQVENNEARDKGDHNTSGLEIMLLDQIDNFRENFKGKYSDQDTGRKTHDKMQFVLKSNGEQTADESGKKRNNGK